MLHVNLFVVIYQSRTAFAFHYFIYLSLSIFVGRHNDIFTLSICDTESSPTFLCQNLTFYMVTFHPAIVPFLQNTRVLLYLSSYEISMLFCVDSTPLTWFIIKYRVTIDFSYYIVFKAQSLNPFVIRLGSEIFTRSIQFVLDKFTEYENSYLNHRMCVS